MDSPRRMPRVSHGLLALLCAGLTGAAGLSVPESAAGREAMRLANVRDQEPEPQSLESQILGVLADATEIATKTRMNADYVPGIVTILRREEMLALGVRTVAEALTLVPGVTVNLRNDGRRKTSFRGLDNGNVDVGVMIDSVPLNTGATGNASYFELPIMQVDRIEVIRGPGSALYGESAFAGLINIITSAQPQLHLRYGEDGTTEAGAVYRFDAPERDLSVRLNLAGWNTRGADLWVESDVLDRVGLTSVSNAPGPVDNGRDYGFAQLKVEAAQASLFAQYQSIHQDPFFGVSGVLPVARSKTDGLDTTQWVVQGEINFSPREHLNGALTLYWNQRTTDLDQCFRPPGAPAIPGVSPALPDGLDAERYIASQRTEADAFLEWTGWLHHRWRVELSMAKEKVLDTWRAYNMDIFTLEPLPVMKRYSGEYAPLDPDAWRSIHSLVLQDEWSILANLDLTFGARYDHYSDVRDSFSPRLAAVWRLNDRHLVKAQVAGAFFPPSLFQRTYVPMPPAEQEYPDSPQQVRTSELGYIFRQSDTVARLTLYYSELFDVIVSTPDAILNRGKERLQGVELEWEQRLWRNLKIEANLSYADTLNKETNAPIPNSTQWLGNLAVFYYPRKDLLLTGRWRYVGERARDPLDTRTDPLSGYNDLSLTLNWFNLGAKGLTLRAGATNLLNASIRSPAPMDTYEQDYPVMESRAFWAQISYTLP
ncbi:TonB-dependent receptor plug domain-containing protein [Rhabdochromatium marinum]|uniref:TonB-dependent receptor plug domain-containing protein n=1 Tax=Rhabdochromatium marinum TaxID=48729 RepID=UPI0019083DE8|nr:TonB-dependent receptor [Rhabdochromatium marinum]MBK1648166.1 hypothetical protein [Rhabdochromatium marinum]